MLRKFKIEVWQGAGSNRILTSTHTVHAATALIAVSNVATRLGLKSAQWMPRSHECQEARALPFILRTSDQP